MRKSTVELKVSHDAMIRIPAESLYALFGEDKSQANLLSPIFNMQPPKHPGKFEGLDLITNHAGFNMVKTLLLKPDIRIEHRYGGDSTGLTVFSAFVLKDLSSTLVAFPEQDGSMMFRLYPSFQEYLHWWTNLLLSRVSNAVSNFLPPPLSVSSFIYGLHAIDCYRRYSYKTALDYEPAMKPLIECNEYNESLNRSISSFDLRWLLSSFFALTPDIEKITFEPETEDLANLVRRTLLVPGKGENAESLFFFGEAGQYLGAEFLRSWELSIGLSARMIVGAEIKPYFRAFITPTALSNHIFQVESEGSEMTVNHQALTFANIILLLEGKLGRPPQIQTEIRAKDLEPPQSTHLPEARLCTVCGETSPPPMKFCGNCGSKLDANEPLKSEIPKNNKPEAPGVKQMSPKEFENLASKLQHAHDLSKIDDAQFKAMHLKFRGKSSDGESWTVGLKSHEWFTEIEGHWVKHEHPSMIFVDKEYIAHVESLIE